MLIVMEMSQSIVGNKNMCNDLINIRNHCYSSMEHGNAWLYFHSSCLKELAGSTWEKELAGSRGIQEDGRENEKIDFDFFLGPVFYPSTGLWTAAGYHAGICVLVTVIA